MRGLAVKEVSSMLSLNFPCSGGSSLKGLSNAPHLPGCRVVNDGAPFVKFSGPGDWSVSSPNGDGRSIHQASALDASFEISFNGTGISLFGIVPPSNQSNPPPAASYIIDNSDFSHSTLPLATECQRNQNFFQLYNLE
ncbi:hypothetical protein L226DRAFT_83824 [Lentinus tigrinus ALCF2SS1-7]|uniref:uncharacterized protein n=1 Tax=Lentinus tigrinus ALCF2SS1-7 TaxID=1328758 RepID=UPI0011663FE9|nr:hypothetical protein L226DRAFT_83824 [Lentinus tigrinus ALCF2SS1-7]